MSENQVVSEAQLKKIRGLADFDLTMLISEIHDHGWEAAQEALAWMPPTDPDRLPPLHAPGRVT